MNNVLAMLGICVVVGAFAVYPIALVSSAETVEIQPKKMERICSGGEKNECFYTVWTDKEVFANKDSLLHFKFNSTDVQNKFALGEKYTVQVVGWRVPFLSMYRNIVEVK